MRTLELTPEQPLAPYGQTRSRHVVELVGFGFVSSLSACLWAAVALAAPPPLVIPGAENFLPVQGAPAPGPFDFLNGISRSENLLGDVWGLRSLLAQYGISLA